MQDFFYGLLFLICGIALVKYSKRVYFWTGKFEWAEKFFGTGGTNTALKLFGIVIMCYAILYMFGDAPGQNIN